MYSYCFIALLLCWDSLFCFVFAISGATWYFYFLRVAGNPDSEGFKAFLHILFDCGHLLLGKLESSKCMGAWFWTRTSCCTLLTYIQYNHPTANTRADIKWQMKAPTLNDSQWMNQEDPTRSQLDFAMQNWSKVKVLELRNPSLQKTSELCAGSSSVCDGGTQKFWHRHWETLRSKFPIETLFMCRNDLVPWTVFQSAAPSLPFFTTGCCVDQT